jgi:DNA modification methylase
VITAKEIEVNKIYVLDTRDGAKMLADNSIDTIITSPPYWNLRDYLTGTWSDSDINCDHIDKSLIGGQGIASKLQHSSIGTQLRQFKNSCKKCGAVRTDKQLGTELTFYKYISDLCDIFDELKRALKPSGTLWVNLGDTYNSSPAGGKLPKKSLLQIPSRFAIEMADRGWTLRNTIIWHKKNAMPQSVTDRFTQDYEFVYLFCKSPRYYFKQQYENSLWYNKDKRAITGGITKSGKSTTEEGGQYALSRSGSFNKKMPGKRQMRSVWSINTKGFKGAHYATFPTDLIEPMILAGCPEFVCNKCGIPREDIVDVIKHQPVENYNGQATKDYDAAKAQNPSNAKRSIINSMTKESKLIGLSDCGCNAGFRPGVVLDPFIGSGTVGLVAKQFNRDYIGFELSDKNAEIANTRIKGE